MMDQAGLLLNMAVEAGLISETAARQWAAKLDDLPAGQDKVQWLVAQGVLSRKQISTLLSDLKTIGPASEQKAVPSEARTIPVAPVSVTSEAKLVPVLEESAVVEPPFLPDTERSPLHVGDVAGNYEIVEVIAKGGMGVVYKAKHVQLGHIVALKVLLAGEGASDQLINRFLREARASAKLQHPNIVGLHEFGTTEAGLHYFTMDFVDGESLADAIEAGRFTPQQSAEMMQVIARAIHYAHTQGIIHRDLKPSNVLLTREGTPRVTDFGLAKTTDETQSFQLSVTGMVMGTPLYMPPEQVAGKVHEVDARSDVYSLGAILYEMLTGRPPFEAESQLTLFWKITEQDAPPPRQLKPGISPDLQTICMKAIAKRPAERYQSALAFAQDLERFCTGEAILARPTRWPTKVVRRVRKRPVVSALVAVVVLAGVVTAYFAVLARHSGRMADLTQQFEKGLEASDWTEARLKQMEAMAAELGSVSPEKGRDARARLYARVEQHVRAHLRKPVVTPDDLAAIEKCIKLLDTRVPDKAPALRRACDERLRAWQTVFELKPPFDNAESVLPQGAFSVEKECLAVGPGRRSVLTRTACQGSVQIEAVFERPSSQPFGLILNGDGERGYAFLVQPPTGSAGGEKPMRLRILRDGAPLREMVVAQKLAPNAPCRLMAKREGARLVMQLNDMPLVTYEDIFPLTGASSGFFGVRWPADAKLKSLCASRQNLPTAPSPLEQGDELYAKGAFADALAFYQQQAVASESESVTSEARYKQGLCLVALKRVDEAEAAFEQVAAQEGKEWPVRASCQLWVLYLRGGRAADAEAVFERLSSHYAFEDLGVMMPDEVRREILRSYVAEAQGLGYLLRVNPDKVRNLERVLRVQQRLEPGVIHWEIDRSVMRAFAAAGQRERALEMAREMMKSPSIQDRAYMCTEYCWLLRQDGKPEKALEVVNDILAKIGDGDPGTRLALLLERARSQVALGNWADAEKDVDTCTAQLGTATQMEHLLISGTWLMKGFLCEHRGDEAGSVAAWRTGYLALAKGREGERAEIFTAADPGGFTLLMLNMMGSLSQQMTIEDARDMFKKIIQEYAQPELAGVFLDVAAPYYSVFCDMWRTPRGRDIARRIAFLQCSFTDCYRLPVLLTAHSAVNLGAFYGKMMAEEEEIAWSGLEHIYSGWVSGKLQPSHALLAYSSWKGVTGPFGWGGVASQLGPNMRGPAAYVFGQKMLTGAQKDLQKAKLFFETALADAPADSALHRLAAEKLALLKGQ